ncbi:MAG: F0F1 ATP synthase subunit delta [Candidatus Omnitrophota bacterium]|nr:F0F1 ATP synthase subunit delta [Candidatus Omnitrophota bacterium]
MPAWQLVVLQVLTFAGLLIALRLLFYRQLNTALQRLQALQEEALVKESQLKDELHRAQQERAAEVERGREEARLLVEAAQQDAETSRANAETQAKQEAEKILARGKAELEKIRVNLSSAIETDAMALSTEMIRHVLTHANTAEFQHHVLNELIGEISALGTDRFSDRATQAVVTSACALTADERSGLRRALSEKLGAEVTLEERLDPELITGLVIHIGSLVIDGSLRNRLHKATQFLRNNKVKGER